MHGDERASAKAATGFVAADRDGAGQHTPKGARARRDDNGATSVRAIIVSSLFSILLTASVLLGGHAAIDPLLHSVLAARDSPAPGDFVAVMPDGNFCRHMSFDSATSEIIEGSVGRCPDGMLRQPIRNATRGFAWGEH
jgi:hypothetical protein